MSRFSTRELVDQILKGKVCHLSQAEEVELKENREVIIEYLSMIIEREFALLKDKKAEFDADVFFWSLELAVFLGAFEAFSWLQRVLHLSQTSFEKHFGDEFIIELSYLLSDVVGSQWQLLKHEIESPTLDHIFRNACLEALVFAVARGRIAREEILAYFKDLLSKIIVKGEFNDGVFPSDLICACADIWPGELLEEIRETFGLSLVGEREITLSCVLREMKEGKEKCLDRLKKKIFKHSFLENLRVNAVRNDEEQKKTERNISSMIEKMNSLRAKADAEAEQLLHPKRNLLCYCKSGLKYKNCCLNKKSNHSNTYIETTTISYEPLDDNLLKALPEADREAILELYYCCNENPEEAVAPLLEYIDKHPHLAVLYNYLYIAYRKLCRPQEAQKVLIKTLELFPDYLFGLTEFAQYLLRRGEEEKAFSVLKNAKTLSQLYPDREIFHCCEIRCFCFVMNQYFIQAGNLIQARLYIELIRKIEPDSFAIDEMEERVRRAIFNTILDDVE